MMWLRKARLNLTLLVFIVFIASLKASLLKNLDDDTLDLIFDILNNKDPLRYNIHKVIIGIFGIIQRRQMLRSSNFEYAVELVVLVTHYNVWESVESYLQKNLGTSTLSLFIVISHCH